MNRIQFQSGLSLPQFMELTPLGQAFEYGSIRC
jgi:hypothetical protein